MQDRAGPSLIKEHTIHLAPDFRLIKDSRPMEKLATIKEVLIVANPAMSGTPLPGAEEEALNIAQKQNSNALTEHQGTKKEVTNQIQEAKIIHFTRHATLDQRKLIDLMIGQPIDDVKECFSVIYLPLKF